MQWFISTILSLGGILWASIGLVNVLNDEGGWFSLVIGVLIFIIGFILLIKNILSYAKKISNSDVNQSNDAEVVEQEFEENEGDNAPSEVIIKNQNGVSAGIITIVVGFLVSGSISIYVATMFGFSFKIIGWVIMLYSCFSGISKILNAKKKVYRAECPYCNHSFEFPVDSLNEECPQCGKKVIIKDGTFQIVE